MHVYISCPIRAPTIFSCCYNLLKPYMTIRNLNLEKALKICLIYGYFTKATKFCGNS